MTAVEFALLAVPFLALLCAIFEVSFVYFSTEQLQGVVSAASRQIYTGSVQSQNISTADQFRNALVCPALPAYMDCSKVIIDVRGATDFTSADMSKSFYLSATKYCPGQPGTVVVVRIIYPLPSIFPLAFPNQFVGLVNNVPSQPGWVHLIMGSAVFQEEPYTAAYTPPASC